uniref:Dehydrin n=1 Tax=Hymenophyllum caudiculatum TaxID=295381 RepID=A0A2R4N522_9MONI|nr:hypothetical protein [Hymenophyllum caudiculatum]
MAQNYRDEEGRKVDFTQEPSDPRLSDPDYTGEGFQDHKTLQERLHEPDYAPTGKRNSDYPFSGVGNPIDGTVGTTGEGKLASDAGQEVPGGEDRYAGWGRDDGKAEDVAGVKAPEQNMGVGAPVMEKFQESPYIQHDSKLDYDKRGYGGEGYEPKHVDEEPVAAHEQKNEPREMESEPVREGPKETMMEKLVPCHKTQTLEDDKHQQQYAEQSPKKAGFVEKIKGKLTGKNQHEGTSPHGEAGYGDLQPTSEPSPPKKGALEKIKGKLSPSP